MQMDSKDYIFHDLYGGGYCNDNAYRVRSELLPLGVEHDIDFNNIFLCTL